MSFFGSAFSRESKTGRAGPTFGISLSQLQNAMADPWIQQNLFLSSSAANQLFGRDYMGLGRATGLRAADTASGALSQALAGRGGGGIGTALSRGAQGRVGAELQGLTTGLGMERDAFATGSNLLSQAIRTRWDILNAIMGGAVTQGGYQVQSESAREQSKYGILGQLIQSLGDVQAARMGGGR